MGTERGIKGESIGKIGLLVKRDQRAMAKDEEEATNPPIREETYAAGC
jgi:hypothetical protein